LNCGQNQHWIELADPQKTEPFFLEAKGRHDMKKKLLGIICFIAAMAAADATAVV